MQATKKKLDQDTLNKHTEDLLLCLPEHASELMHEIADDYHLPIWQIFCGVVLEVHMQGNLSNFYLEPAWAEGLKQYDYTCKQCKKSFTPKHLGQVFCSNECGEAHIIKEVPKNAPVIAKPTPSVAANVNTNTDDLADRIARLSTKTGSGWANGPELPTD